MKSKKFTFTSIKGFQCEEGKNQSIFSDKKTPGLGLRVTASGYKSYIFETKLHGKTLRITIGDSKTWPVSEAQAEAARLKVMTDQGIDPREVNKEKEAARAAKIQKEKLERLTFGEAWQEYVDERKHQWSEHHIKDHLKMINPGGQTRACSDKLTVSGCLSSFMDSRLIDTTPEKLNEWAKKEANRPTQARLAMRLTRAFLNWCAEHNKYKTIITSNPVQNKKIYEILGKQKVKNDALQREQLPCWFNATKKIHNPVISAYLQSLLLTGARPNELISIRWEDIDFQWNTINIKDKVDGLRTIPLTPYVSHLLNNLPRRNQWVFSSPAAAGRLADPRTAHNKACDIVGLKLTLHGLRRSFASLCEWIEMPSGIAAQIQGHKPQGVREQNYIRRPLDLLRMWHIKIESWILEQAGIEYTPQETKLHIAK